MLTEFHIILAIILLGVIVAFRNRQYLKEGAIRYFGSFLMLTFLVQYGGYYYSVIFKTNNDLIFTIFGMVEAVFFFLYFHSLLKGNEKILVRVFAVIYFIFALLDLFFIQKFDLLNTYSEILLAFLIVICCGFYYRSVLVNKVYIDLIREPKFWITNGLVLFYGGQFVLIFEFAYLLKSDLNNSLRLYWLLMAPLNMIEYSLFGIGLYVARPR